VKINTRFYHIPLNYFRTKNIFKKLCIKSKHTFYVYKPFPQNHAAYEIMWKNIVQPDRPQTTIWRMRIACWIPKATNTHSEYVIPTAFPLQRWLQERASMLQYARTYLPVLLSSCP